MCAYCLGHERKCVSVDGSNAGDEQILERLLEEKLSQKVTREGLRNPCAEEGKGGDVGAAGFGRRCKTTVVDRQLTLMQVLVVAAAREKCIEPGARISQSSQPLFESTLRCDPCRYDHPPSPCGGFVEFPTAPKDVDDARGGFIELAADDEDVSF